MIEHRELDPEELEETWSLLSTAERVEGFMLLDAEEAEEFFFALPAREQAELLEAFSRGQRRLWIRLLAPDDVADVIQAADEDRRQELLELLDPATRKEVTALLAYEEDDAGGLMNPRFARVRADMSVDEAISYLRRQAVSATAAVETLYYAYVLDPQQRLVGVVSLRQLFAAPPRVPVREIMDTDLVAAHEEMDQEALADLFAEHDLVAIPVIDADGHMKGIVTVDDIVDVVREEATEDVQKYGGMEALDAPYLDIGFFKMVRKRAGWLSILFVGEMFTATALGFYQTEIGKALVLSLFMPLIISSGGNSGSQASTLVVRAMAVGEVRLRDWFRVIRRELAAGVVLGVALAIIGFLRILAWQAIGNVYGVHYLLIALTIAASLVGVVTWGTIAGSMLPFLLRRVGFDPASASAPFVATLVDVVGLIIYFTVASLLLRGVLL